ncbi:ankyrin repeat-containing domain protein [Xylaria sp. FL1777]|nr:ankyrin repeat-containing domain protein [Xylaria sp. FL1777]
MLEHGGISSCHQHRNASQSRDITKNSVVHSLIYEAANVETVEALLPYCSNLNPDDDDMVYRRPALHQICNRDYSNVSNISEVIKIVKALVKSGAGFDSVKTRLRYDEPTHRTPLDLACINATPDLIQYLLEMGAPVGGMTLSDLLLGAHVSGFYDHRSSSEWWDKKVSNICKSAKLLFDHGFSGRQDPFNLSNKDILVNAEYACAVLKTDSNELWTILIDGGLAHGVFDVHRRNEFGQTFLSQLVSGQFGEKTVEYPSWKPNLLRALVKAGSDLNVIDSNGLTPLHYAIFRGHFDTAKLLIELGADPAQQVNGATPTHYAFGKPFACNGPVVERIVSSFLQHLTKYLKRYYQEETPLRWDASEAMALEDVSRFRQPILNPILSLCSDRFMRDKHGILVKDAENRMFSIMALLSPWADIARDENGHTPREITRSTSVGLLEGSEDLSSYLDLQSDSDVTEARQERTGWCDWSDREDGNLCRCAYNRCVYCGSLPRPLLDLDTDRFRPIPLTRFKVSTEHGEPIYLPATMARFK